MVENKNAMEYRFLGKTGLKVSVISYGNWLNSDTADLAERTNKLVKKAWDVGINFFDTAEVNCIKIDHKIYLVFIKIRFMDLEKLKNKLG